jgi:hypothetical protein
MGVPLYIEGAEMSILTWEEEHSRRMEKIT